MTGVLRQKDAFLSGGKAPSDHKYILTGKKFPIAGGAVGNSPTTERLLSPKSHHPGVRPGGQQDAKALFLTSAGLNALDISGQFQTCDLGQQKFGPKRLSLTAHGFGKPGAAGPFHTGIVYDL